MKIENRFRKIWKWDKVISRVAASWVWFVVCSLVLWGDYRELAFGQQYGMPIAGVWTLANFVLFSLLCIVCQPYHTDSWLLMGGTAICAWLWLVNAPTGTNGMLTWLAVAVLCALVFVWGVHVNRRVFCRWKLSRPTAVIIGVVGAVVSCAVISVITCLRYKTFSSPTYSLSEQMPL